MWEKPDRDVVVDERLQAKYLGEIQSLVDEVRGLIVRMLDAMHAVGFDVATDAGMVSVEFEVYCRGRYALKLLSRVSEVITGRPLPEAGYEGAPPYDRRGVQLYYVMTGADSAADATSTLVPDSEICQLGMVQAFEGLEAYYRKVIHLGHNNTAYALAQTCPAALVALADLWESMASLQWLTSRWN